MSEYDCNGSCASCGSDCDAEGHATVTLTLDDGTVQECAILTVFPVSGRDYIALLPLNEQGENEDGEVYIYRYEESNGEPHLDNIESDEEYEMVADAFDEMLDAAEFDELMEEEGAES